MPARDFDATIRTGLSRLGWDLPLLQALLGERHVRFARRATDPGWGTVIGLDVAGGFSPFDRALQVPERSPLAAWSANADPTRDARDFNASDALVRQVLYLLHDYLHAWAYARIRERLPRTAPFLRKRVTTSDLEHHVFCHLVSEAVATVGLDYWYLAEIDLDSVVGMGTEVVNLTTSYRLSSAPELARHADRGRLDSRSPRFFEKLAAFYCTGEFLGFSPRGLARSPKLLRWLTHELRYGESQRAYTRQWLSYLATGRRPSEAEASRPVRCSEPWQRNLIRDVGTALHAFVREGRADPVERHGYEPRSRPITEVDLRFMNLRDERSLARAMADPFVTGAQFAWLAAHRASRHRFPGDGSAGALALPGVVESGSPLLLERFLAGEEPVSREGARGEPEELFLLG